MKIEGSVALVTGGVSGLGFGAASRFVRGGGSVVMLDIDEAQGAAALDALEGNARFIHCDVRDPQGVADAVGRAPRSGDGSTSWSMPPGWRRLSA